MRSRSVILTPFLLITFMLSTFVFSVTSSGTVRVVQAQAETPANAAVNVNGNRFDPRNFSGIYVRSGGDAGFGPVQGMPPLTPAGEEKLRNALPVRSRHPLAKEAANAAASNDPSVACNPKGLPRLLVDTTSSHHEVIMLPNRMLQLWQEERRPREIWIDGRSVPSEEALAALGPTWYGHAVGVWQGDTLVVTTVGIDDRAWLDSFGFPKGVDARVEERYRMVDANTLEVTLTLNDPEMYARPWVSDVKTWKKEPRQNVTRRSWFGVFGGVKQVICVPTEVKR